MVMDMVERMEVLQSMGTGLEWPWSEFFEDRLACNQKGGYSILDG